MYRACRVVDLKLPIYQAGEYFRRHQKNKNWAILGETPGANGEDHEFLLVDNAENAPNDIVTTTKRKALIYCFELLVAAVVFSGTITQKVTHHNIEMQNVNEKNIASYNWPLQPCVSASLFEINSLVTTLR